MRIIVTGATGNLGSAVVRELSSAGHAVVGVARRAPNVRPDGPASVEWRSTDLTRDDLVPVLAEADAAVHLAWRFQPTRMPDVTWEANAVGTRRLLDAAVVTRLSALVCASSIAAYSPVDHDDPVEEGWATDGASSAAYCREKAYVERLLDDFERRQDSTRTVRLRPAFVFQRSAASEQRRIFGGALARPTLFARGRLPVVPVPAGLRFQAVHAGDVAVAVREAVERPVCGPVNLAGPGLLRRGEVEHLLGARTLGVPRAAVRTALAAAYAARAAPVPPSLLDALLHLPVMSTTHAEQLLDWRPRHTARDAVATFLDGARLRAGSDLPPLHR